MARLKDEIVRFFEEQGFAIVSTIDGSGYPRTSCKGIVEISPQGKVYLLDLYTGHTYANLKRNTRICLTAVDEHKFKGYCLKGKARIVNKGDIPNRIFKLWEDKITSRLTQRLLRNIRDEKSHSRHPEILLPHPAYMIAVDIEEVVDLTPRHLKE